MPSFDDLTFEPLLIPNGLNYVPRIYFEQVKENDRIINNIYKYGPAFILNPLNRFWTLMDVGHQVKGILWITIDPLEEMIYLVILSVDKEYQQLNGSLRKTPSEIIKKVVEHLKSFKDELENKSGIKLKNKIMALARHPKAVKRSGFKRSKKVMLEIEI